MYSGARKIATSGAGRESHCNKPRVRRRRRCESGRINKASRTEKSLERAGAGFEIVGDGTEERAFPSQVICNDGVKTLLSFNRKPACSRRWAA